MSRHVVNNKILTDVNKRRRHEKQLFKGKHHFRTSNRHSLLRFTYFDSLGSDSAARCDHAVSVRRPKLLQPASVVHPHTHIQDTLISSVRAQATHSSISGWVGVESLLQVRLLQVRQTGTVWKVREAATQTPRLTALISPSYWFLKCTSVKPLSRLQVHFRLRHSDNHSVLWFMSCTA